jgi:hypothetical protein
LPRARASADAAAGTVRTRRSVGNKREASGRRRVGKRKLKVEFIYLGAWMLKRS